MDGQMQGKIHNRIAVLGREINEAYQSELWRGISDEAERHKKQLICFLGYRTETGAASERKPDSLYRLAHSGSFDGAIIVSSAVSTYLEPAQVRSLFDVRPMIPKISIGIQLDGIGSVCVDGRDAMKQVTEHLVRVHNRKHFAVIAGPHRHPESEQRRRTVIEVLNSLGLSVEKDMLIHGMFDHLSGAEAMKRLISGGRKIDAVICLNDAMAIGAIQELASRNISVPDMISVTGFDGIEESAYCSPPLTTIRQPLYQVGVEAVKELYRLMEGGAPREKTLTCVPVIRQSCSCRLNTASSGLNRPVFTTGSGAANIGSIVDLDVLNILYKENKPEDFLRELERFIGSSIFRQEDYFLLEQELAEMEDGLSEPYAVWFRVLGDARRLLWENRTRYLINQRIRKKQRSDLLRSVGTSLTGAFELPELFTQLADGLTKLGFNHGFLVIYENAVKTELPEFRLMFKMRHGSFVPGTSVSFSNKEVLPDLGSELDVGDCVSWMFTPLSFQNRNIGHMLLPGNHPDTEIYDTLTKQIASSVQGAILLDQVRSHEKSLVREVERRTEELTLVNTELRQEISTRSRLEQEVIDISKHTMERIGQDLHDDLCQHLAGVSMHVSALRCRIEKTDPDAVSNTDLISRLLSDSITRAKSITRGLLPLGLEDEGLSVVLEGLCGELSLLSGINIDYHGDQKINRLDSERAMELYRIVQEALNNAIKHSGGTIIKVSVETNLKDERLSFSIIIEDNGKGFDAGKNPGGMGLKIMRYRGERAGISVNVYPSAAGVKVVCTGVYSKEP